MKIGSFVVKQRIKRFLGYLSNKSYYIGLFNGISSLLAFLSIFYCVSFRSVPDIFITVLCFIAFFTLLISIVAFAVNYYSTKDTQTFVCSEYYALLHDFRNSMKKLELEYEDTLIAEGMADIFLERMNRLIMRVLDHLVKTVNYVSGDAVSASVKLIDYSENQGKDSSSFNGYVRTFARDSDSFKERHKRDGTQAASNASIHDNTDFTYFFESDTSYFMDSMFYQSNLMKYDRIRRSVGLSGYKNSNSDWREYYVGTAVAPIRIKAKLLDIKCSDEERFFVIGFLCIDSLSTKVFTHRRKRLFACILKGYAAIMFYMLYFVQKVLMKNTRVFVVE